MKYSIPFSLGARDEEFLQANETIKAQILRTFRLEADDLRKAMEMQMPIRTGSSADSWMRPPNPYAEVARLLANDVGCPHGFVMYDHLEIEGIVMVQHGDDPDVVYKGAKRILLTPDGHAELAAWAGTVCRLLGKSVSKEADDSPRVPIRKAQFGPGWTGGRHG